MRSLLCSARAKETLEWLSSDIFGKVVQLKKEESEYVPRPKFYTFKSRDERERILYKNFVQVGQDVKAMIADISNKKNAK